MNTPGIPALLAEIYERIFRPMGFGLEHLESHTESFAYDACSFTVQKVPVVFRKAKITPTKTGQFVTLWKRSTAGPIAPYAITDPAALFIIATKTEHRLGIFLFPKAVLAQQKVVTTATKEGKRALRVYPPWDSVTTKQAQKTQQWQLDYFVEIPTDDTIDSKRIQELFQDSM